VDEGIVIVGGGLAAATLAGAYREAGGEELVTILSADDRPPYHRPPLTKGYLRGDIEEESQTYVQQPEYYDENVIDVQLETDVTGIDTEAREVVTGSGERLSYDQLVIATGARPRTLPVPGADRVGVHTYRTLADATAVRDEAVEAHKAVVIGGSFIGSEVAASLRMRGLDVTVVERGDRLMPALSSDELSDQLADFYREQGVELALGDSVEELHGHGRLLSGARLASGRDVEAYLAVVGVGVQPNVELLAGTQIEIDDGVIVDDRLRTSVDGVFAVGDVARFPDPVSGRPRRIEHWSNANAQGRQLGQVLAGRDEPYDEVAVFFTQLFDLKLQVLGDPDGGVDESVLLGSVADRRLLGFHVRDGQVVGAVLSGQAADLVERVKALVRERPEVDDPEALLADARWRTAVASS
jgi:3-phenylpropionate/trans-cinnamate dioxygenase ferredoxin reductase component